MVPAQSVPAIMAAKPRAALPFADMAGLLLAPAFACSWIFMSAACAHQLRRMALEHQLINPMAQPSAMRGSDFNPT